MTSPWETGRGRGCHHCEVGVPIDHIEASRGYIIRLCLECVMLWFPDWTVAQWEAAHAPFGDHVQAAIKLAAEREKLVNLRAFNESRRQARAAGITR